MSRRIVLSLAALILTPACKQAQIATATPLDELPPLIVPAELRVDAGSMNSSGGGSQLARNDVGDDGGSSSSDWRSTADDSGKRSSGSSGDGGKGGAMVSASPQPTAYALIVGIEKYLGSGLVRTVHGVGYALEV